MSGRKDSHLDMGNWKRSLMLGCEKGDWHLYIWDTGGVVYGILEGVIDAWRGVVCGTLEGVIDAGRGVVYGTLEGVIDAGRGVVYGTMEGVIDAWRGVVYGTLEGVIDAGRRVVYGTLEGLINAGRGVVYNLPKLLHHINNIHVFYRMISGRRSVQRSSSSVIRLLGL